MAKSNAFLLVQWTAQKISLLIFYVVANESQCNSDQASDLEKNSDQHHQNFHSPRGTNPSNDCTASYVFPNLDHDNDNKAFPENPYKRPVLFHAKVVSIEKMGFLRENDTLRENMSRLRNKV